MNDYETWCETIFVELQEEGLISNDTLPSYNLYIKWITSGDTWIDVQKNDFDELEMRS